MNANNLIKDLYESIDAKKTNYLDQILAEQVQFRIGNYDIVSGKQAVLAANQEFFTSIDKMSHTIDNVWAVKDDIICNGQVSYVRLDGSEFSVTFATTLKLQENRIIDYLVYVDISGL